MAYRSTQLSAIPSLLINPMRDVIQGQGLPREVITPAGELDTNLLAKSLVTSIELRSEMTRPYVLPVAKLVDGPSNPLWKQVKPTVVLTGPRIGRVVVAPYGEASKQGSDSALWTLGLGLVTLFSGGVLLGGLMNRKR